MLCLKCQFSGDTRAHDQLCGDQSGRVTGVYSAGLAGISSQCIIVGRFSPPHQSSFDVEISLKLISYP